MDIHDLKYKYRTADVVMKIIYITAIVFLISFFAKTISFLSGTSGNFLVEWFALSPDFNRLLYKPWTLVTYGFLHSGFMHILFNLLVLYYIGRLFLDFFTEKQFLIYYFSGILFGGLIFLLSYNYLPGLRTGNNFLVGASAGVTAVLVGLAAYIPNFALHLMFLGRVPLKYIAIFLVFLDVIQIPDGNAGGHLAHLGGALIGFLLTNNLNKGAAVSSWIDNIFKPKKKKPFKTVYRNQKSATTRPVKDDYQQRVDAILDKISKSGYEALTKEEKEFLFKAGKK